MQVRSSLHGPYDALAPPPLAGPFAFVVRAPVVTIPASREAVWRVLTAYEEYEAWCPFTRRIVTTGALGNPVELHLDWDPTRLGPPREMQVETITVHEPPFCVAWGASFAGGLVRAERTQVLEAVEGGTRYHCYDRMAGLAAPLVRAFFGQKMERGFAAVGRALRARVVQM